MKEKIKRLLKSRKTKRISIILACILCLVIICWQVVYPVCRLHITERGSFTSIVNNAIIGGDHNLAGEIFNSYKKCEEFSITRAEAKLYSDYLREELDASCKCVEGRKQMNMIDGNITLNLPSNWKEYGDRYSPYISPYKDSDFRLSRSHGGYIDKKEEACKMEIPGIKESYYWVDERVDFRERRVGEMFVCVVGQNDEKYQFSLQFNKDVVMDPDEIISWLFKDMKINGSKESGKNI